VAVPAGPAAVVPMQPVPPTAPPRPSAPAEATAATIPGREAPAAAPRRTQPPQAPNSGATPEASASTEALAERVKRSIAFIDGKEGSGTAFVVRPRILATNFHVIRGECLENLRVRFISPGSPNAKPLPVKLLYRDPRRDLALLGIESDQEALPLAGDGEVRKGHPVLVVGNPSRAGGAFQEVNAVSEGRVETTVIIRGETWYHLKADAAPGNSGGPVIDRKTGEVVGVLTLLLARVANDYQPPLPPLPGRPRLPAPAAPAPVRPTGDAFCVPCQFLRQALTEIETASARDRRANEVTARYAAETLVAGLHEAQEQSGKTAITQIDVLAQGWGANITSVTWAYHLLHERVMERLRPFIRQVKQGRHLNRGTQASVLELLANYEQINRLVERPRGGSIKAYRAYFNELARKHYQLLKALSKDLDVPDDLEVRLLK
jgi:S1-C subfamily serine protease